MEISSILFNEITGQKGLPAAPGSVEADRRKQHRFSFGARATIHAVGSGGNGPGAVVLLRDVSVGSIGFIHFEAIDPGTPFIIKFNGETGRTFRIQAASARCEPGGVGGKQFCIGATFEQLIEPGEEEIKAIETAAQAQPAAAVPAEPVAEPPRRNRIFAAKNAETPVATTAVPFAPPVAARAPMVIAASPMPVAMVAAPALPVAPEPVATPEPLVLTMPFPPEPEETPAAALKHAETVEVVPEAESSMEGTPPALNAIVMPVEKASSMASPAPIKEAEGGVHVQTEPGHNRHVVDQVKSRLLKQGQMLAGVARQLEEAREELNAQKAQAINLACERDELKAQLAEVQQQLMRERDEAMQQLAQMLDEMGPMKEMLTALQAKSDADDKSIAELASLVGGETD